MDPSSDVQKYLPLTEPTLYILMCLSSGPKHGYAIMKEVEEMSKGQITFSTGTLYGALKRLLDQNWIARSGDDQEGKEEPGRARKEYELTSLGSLIYNAEINRMRELVWRAGCASSETA